MKISTFASLASFTLLVGNAHALTIIDSSTRNGSFEELTATGSQNSAEFWSFGFNSTQFERLDNDANTPDGNYSAVVGTNNADPTGYSGAYQNTGYEVSGGDSFSLSFDWAGAFNWQSWDDLNWRLFTTSDNTTGGVVTEIASGFVTGKSASTLPLTNWSTVNVLVDGGSITGPSLGQDLFIEFYENNGINQFARIDKVVLTVVPEPSSFALVAGSLAMVVFLVRRRG